jgi:hypothetical protein
LEIERNLQEFLRKTNQLTPARLRAISQARFETARIAWQYDTSFANGIMEEVRKADPDFWPGGNAAPPHYKIVFRALGFRFAESLAAVTRSTLRQLRS